MDEFEKGLIFEYMESLYDELERIDGQYLPHSKHDKHVKEATMTKFNISAEKVDEIYDVFSQKAAKRQVEAINKLPMQMRKEKSLELLSDILKNNGDAPWRQIEGAPKNKLKSSLDLLYEEYIDIAETIGEFGWSIPMSMGLSKIDNLKGIELNEGNINILFEKFYDDKQLKESSKHILKSNINEHLKSVFVECIEIFNMGKYIASTTTLLTVLEGVLSDFGDDQTDTRMKRICKFQMDKTKLDNKIINHLIWVSIYKFIDELYSKSKFNQNEPRQINRHWILHGRTKREVGRIDAIRIVNAIHSLITIEKYSK